MKNRYSFFALIFLLVLSFCIPAAAVREYGVIYDETESLGPQTLAMQGEQTLPQLSEKLGIDMRVDVITKSDNGRIGDTAKWIYNTYEYGYGDYKEGLTLTVLLEQHEDEYTYAMSDEDWCIYTTLGQGRGSSKQLDCVVRDAVEPFMAERAWNGEDMTRIISLNETSLYLWNAMYGKEFEVEDASAALISEYGIDADVASRDAQSWCDRLKECNLLEK